MNNFEQTLAKLVEEADSVQKKELALRAEAQLFNQKLMGFLKEHGLPDDFTVPELAMLAIRKSRELVHL